MESRYHRVGKFALVGMMNTVVDFTVFVLLYYGGDWDVLAANTSAYMIAVANSFLLNKYWTFAETRRSRAALPQFGLFLGFNLGGLGLSNLTIWLLTPAIPALLAKGLATAVTFVWNYQTSRAFVYRRQAGT